MNKTASKIQKDQGLILVSFLSLPPLLFLVFNRSPSFSSSLIPCPVSQPGHLPLLKTGLIPNDSRVQFALLCLPVFFFSHTLLCCVLAVQDKCDFLLFFFSSSPRFPSFTPRLLTTSFCLPFSHSLQISSAPQLLLFLQLAAARLHLLHVSAWACSLSLSLYTHSLSLFYPVYTPPPPPLHRVTMETLGPYGDRLVLVHKECKCVCLCAWVETVQQ